MRWPLRSLALLALLSPVACGDDAGGSGGETDGAETENGETGGPGSDSSPSSGNTDPGGSETTDGCIPLTCEDAGAACGEVDDGCGAPLDCGGCDLGECIEGACVFEPASAFDDDAVDWAVPEGGQRFAGFDALGGNAGTSDASTVGGQEWSTVDLDGDGYLDLVVTAEAVERDGYYWWAQVLGHDENDPHWDVYLGSADGFAASPVAWDLPQGGQQFAGFDALAGNAGTTDASTVGAQEWATADLDGDGRLDLVVTAEAVERDGYYWWAQVLGHDENDPHWDVYLGQDGGFASSPTAWSLPEGGQRFAGFDALGGSAGTPDASTVGAQEWTTTDLDGDGIPDLVVTAEAVERDGYYWWAQVLGHDENDPHWDVYLGTGSGFAASPVAWDLPQGGQQFAGFDALAGEAGTPDASTVGAQEWSTVDLDGDGRLDLVVTAEAVERDGYYWWAQVLGFGSAPHWDVYLGQDGGFAGEATAWALPSGGQSMAGFDALGGNAGTSDASTVGGEEWTTLDVTGDGIPDLVVTAEAVERDGYYWWAQVLGYGGDPHWRVYAGSADGFSSEASTWSVPEGGQSLSGFDATAGNAGTSDASTVGGEEWSTADIDGDGYIDLVVTAEAVERDGYYWWAQVFGFGGDSPHWRVYRGRP